MSKSLNKVMLIGNVTKDPEMKYTPQGTAVVSFSLATNRSWKDSTGKLNDEATYHRIVAWSKLAEIVNQYIVKGSKVYLEGRINNRSWEDNNKVMHYLTEIVADNLIMLDSKKSNVSVQPNVPQENTVQQNQLDYPPEPSTVTSDNLVKKRGTEELDPDDIPF